VFVVSLARGTSSGSAAIRVMPDDGTGEAAVAVGGFRSEAEDRALEADREESKRLLYVAITRARDRLYLAATVRGAHARMPRGSLGEVLPRSFLAFVAEVSGMPADQASATWRSVAGPTHEFARLTRTDGEQVIAARGAVTAHPRNEAESPAAPPPTAPSSKPTVRIVDAREWALEQHGVTARERATRGDSHVLVGRLTHRLFQASLPADAALDVLETAAQRLLRADEVSGESAAAVAHAARAFSALRQDPEVAELLASGEVRYEVPFTLRVDVGAGDEAHDADAYANIVLVRGTVDCLVLHHSDCATVLEFKTGGRASWHASQLTTYVDAMRRVFPTRSVTGRLVYPPE
jgi:ATP-dependent helicase/nuclease subunit A